MARAAKSSRVTYYGTWTVSRALLALQRKLKNELIETANGVLLIRRGSLGIKLLGAVDYLNNYTGYRVSLCNTKTLKAMAKIYRRWFSQQRMENMNAREDPPMDAADKMLLDYGIRSAEHEEKETGRPHYVLLNASPYGTHVQVTTRRSLKGEWYDSDGIRHG